LRFSVISQPGETFKTILQLGSCQLQMMMLVFPKSTFWRRHAKTSLKFRPKRTINPFKGKHRIIATGVESQFRLKWSRGAGAICIVSIRISPALIQPSRC
jgi:hypothetical protein